jgi:mono/diheme cytochrome c family protein
LTSGNSYNFTARILNEGESVNSRSWIAAGAGVAGLVIASVLVGAADPGDAPLPPSSEQRHVAAASPESAGEYLVKIGGCNDCHTAGYAQSGGKVPVAQWFTGNPVGYRGPWGTTFASNLRLYVDPMSEDDWVRVMRSRDDKPPMPWPSLHAMSGADLRAIHRFIKSLGKAGKPTPQDVPPGVEPQTPFELLAPPMMPASEKK